MKNKLGKLTALLLALALLLSGCNLIGIDPIKQLEEDRAKLEKSYQTVMATYDGGSVTVGDIVYDFYSQYGYYYQLYSMYGMTLDEDTINSLKKNCVDNAVNCVAQLKECETRGIALTDAEIAGLETSARETYNSYLTEYTAEMDGKTEKVRTAQAEYELCVRGVTVESILEAEKTQSLVNKLREALDAEVSEVSDETLQAAYEARVEKDESSYADNPGSFESAMMNADTVVTWMPEGYRTVKHILLVPDSEKLTAYTEKKSQIESLGTDLEALNNDLAAAMDDDTVDTTATDGAATDGTAADAAATDAVATDGTAADAAATDAAATDAVATDGTVADGAATDAVATDGAATDGTAADETAVDPDSIRAKIADVEASITAATAELTTLKAACLADVQDKIDAIRQRLADGEDFQTLIDEFGEDPGMKNEPTASRGYYVSVGSTSWDVAFRDAAMLLDNIGDVSDPVLGKSGVHIIRYESDVTPGAVPLEDVRDSVYKAALDEQQDAHYTETVTALVGALNPVYSYDNWNPLA